ncbi:MAG: LysR family transcriptional regulator [Gammaproteobacteria bacterium]|nr:LysR family transcriptional regulator [Gammaproteobacteria bacterium]
MKTPRVSLEQWATFKAVVDAGSFAMAAEQLNKSQSSVSYAIARLNEQLPQPVLQLEGRRAVLTEEGKALYRRASQLLQHAEETEEFAQMLSAGVESEVTLALDNLLDLHAIIPALDQFSAQYPFTRIRILETSLSGTEEALLEKKADIVIGGKVPVGFAGTPVRQARMIAVAHPDHPLFQRAGQGSDQGVGQECITDWELKSWRQIVLRDTGQRREQDAGWLGSEQRWTVSHFASSLKILRSGLAFAFLPEDWVAEDLREGRLRKLPLAEGTERIIQLYLMLSSKEGAGPATRTLASMLTSCLSASR